MTHTFRENYIISAENSEALNRVAEKTGKTKAQLYHEAMEKLLTEVYHEKWGEKPQHGGDRKKRLAQFDQSARAIGEEVARQALTEDDIDAFIEAARQELHDQ